MSITSLTPLPLLPGWWLVENEDKRMAWFPAPYLEKVEGDEEDDSDGSYGESKRLSSLIPYTYVFMFSIVWEGIIRGTVCKNVHINKYIKHSHIADAPASRHILYCACTARWGPPLTVYCHILMLHRS